MSNAAIQPLSVFPQTKVKGGTASNGWISRWIVVAAALLLVNVLLLVLGAVPAIRGLANEKIRQSSVKEIPLWKGLIAESDLLFGQLREMNVLTGDAVAVMNGIQRESESYGIRILNMGKLTGTDGRFTSVLGSVKNPALGVVFLDLQVEGNYRQISQWVSAIESRPSLQIENFVITAPEEGKNKCSIQMTLSVLTENK